MNYPEILLEIESLNHEVLTMSDERLILSKIADNTPVIFYIYDVLAQKNVYINQAVTKILGYAASSIIDNSWNSFWQWLHIEDQQRLREHQQQFLTIKDQEMLEIDYRIQDIQGNWHWLRSRDVVLSRNPAGMPQQILSSITEITKQKLEQAKYQQQHQAEALVATIAQKIHQSLQLDDILNTTVTEVQQFLQVNRVLIYQFRHDWSGVVVVEAVESPWKSLLNRVLLDQEFVDNFIHLYRQGRIQATADIYNDALTPCHIEWLAQLQVRANLVVPILQREELWGLLVAQHCATPRQWHSWEIELLQQLSTQVGIAIEQAELYRELEIANQEWQRLATLDGLTQVANRRCFDDCLKREWRRLIREKTYLSVIMCDLDYFRAYNDYYGHPAGDYCLQEIAIALRKSLKRPADLVARYGGEEFAIILPNTDAKGAIQVAGEIRSRMRILKLEHLASPISQYVTLSFGVATIIPCSEQQPLNLMNNASHALYEAKSQGRDRIVLYN